MKRTSSALHCIVWVLLLLTVGSGHQSKGNQTLQRWPDFSGRWVLDIGSSKLGRERTVIKVVGVTLLISQNGPELKLTETTDYEGIERSEQTILYLDGRGETNRSAINSVAVKSKTQLKGSTLVTKSSRNEMRPVPDDRPSNDKAFGTNNDPFNRNPAQIDTRFYQGPYIIDGRQTRTTVKRELSADGGTLAVTTSIRGREGTHLVTHVFQRVR